MLWLMNKAKLYSILGVLTIISVLGVNFYYKWSQNKIDRLSEQLVVMMETQNALINVSHTNKNTIDNLKNELDTFKRNITELHIRLDEAEEYSKELEEIFNDSDLAELAARKSNLIEKRVNDATVRIFEDIESITDN